MDERRVAAETRTTISCELGVYAAGLVVTIAKRRASAHLPSNAALVRLGA